MWSKDRLEEYFGDAQKRGASLVFLTLYLSDAEWPHFFLKSIVQKVILLYLVRGLKAGELPLLSIPQYPCFRPYCLFSRVKSHLNSEDLLCSEYQ